MLQLKEAVRIPMSTFMRDWQQQSFEAWVSSEEILAKGASKKLTYDRLFFGALLRLPNRDQSSTSEPEDFLAYCTFCSHEACEVKLLEDTSAVKSVQEVRPEHPLVVCPCHASIYDPLDQGRLLSGPAPRGLYRFKFQRKDDHIEITHIESAAMELFKS
jgi:Rieske Fe-S protein